MTLKAHETMERYLAHPAIDNSLLELLAYSPALFNDARQHKRPDAPTPAMLLGTLLHAAALEGRHDYTVRPDTYKDGKGHPKPWSGNAEACKAWLTEHAAETIVSPDTAALIKASAAALRADPHARKILKGAITEVSLYATDTETGLKLKGRADAMDDDRFVELKTTHDARTETLSRTMYRDGWHRKLGLYVHIARLNGLDPKHAYIIALETSTPPRVNARRLTDMTLALGIDETARQLATVAECEAAGTWPDYSGPATAPIGELSAPNYAFTRFEQIELTVGERSITL